MEYEYQISLCTSVSFLGSPPYSGRLRIELPCNNRRWLLRTNRSKIESELRSSLRNFESQNEYGYKPCIKRRFQNAETLQSKRYSPEIRRTALELVNQGQTQIEVAQALGVSPKTLSHWVTTTQARMPDQQRNELEELKRLRLQVRKQQAEIDFLKKAAAYFAKLPK